MSTLPSEIVFRLEPTTDTEITCIMCGYRQVDLEFVVKGDGRIAGIGVHSRCVPRLITRNPQPATVPTPSRPDPGGLY